MISAPGGQGSSGSPRPGPGPVLRVPWCPSVRPGNAGLPRVLAHRGADGPAGISPLLLLCQRRVNCQSRQEETYSLLTIFNLKMQMLLASRWRVREPVCHALTSIRGIRRTAPHWHFASVTVTALAAQMPGCHTEVYHRVFFLRMQTNKPRNYNCLPAESVIGGNNDISALLISLPPRLAPSY